MIGYLRCLLFGHPVSGMDCPRCGRRARVGPMTPWRDAPLHHTLPAETRRPWQEWNLLPQPDGMTIYDPDGFRGGRPTVVTYDEFCLARFECTLVDPGVYVR